MKKLFQTKNNHESDVLTDTHSYYKNAETWYEETYRNMLISRNRAWMIGIIGMVMGLCGILVLIMILPLKELVPYVVEVNRITGETYVKKPLQESNVPVDEALTKYFLVKYIKCRETFDIRDVKENYEITAYFSDGNTLREYNNLFSSTNPNSPMKKYGEKTRRDVRVKAISFLNKNTASVRFETTEKTFEQVISNHWVAIVSFKYVNRPEGEADRFVNPLGFKITEYRVDQEVLNEKG